MNRPGAVLLLLAVIAAPSWEAASADGADSRSAPLHVRIADPRRPLAFEQNRGQTDASVRFLSRGNGYTVFLTADEAVVALRGTGQPSAAEDRSRSTLRLRLVGTAAARQITGLDPLPGKSNYFIGDDPDRWQANIPTYARVKYQDVYSGIDLVYYGNQGQLECDFAVAPGADPTRIKLDIRSVDSSQPALKGAYPERPSLRISPRGDLVIETAAGEIAFHKPVVYQRGATTAAKTFVDARYVIAADHTVSFEVGRYDTSEALVIDPVLSYSTYLGGSGMDTGNAIAVDAAGNAYITGETTSTDFPTAGAVQGGNAGASDVFITKLDANGSLIYSTYVGGALSERGTSIAVDSAGNVAVTGRTNSVDFPLANAWQSQLFGDFDAFVVQLNPQGNALRFATYLGGSGNDEGSGIAVDSSGAIYVTGGVSFMSGDDFPTTQSAFQRLFGGGPNDAFVTKFDPTQSGSAILVYSTFLGGGDIDRGNSIAVDASGNAYVTGRTKSPDFPARTLQTTYGGDPYDAFVTKLNSTGTDLVYSTYLGGSAYDQGYGIAVDGAGSAYITGQTASSNFPTVNGYQGTNVGASDAFLTKIDPTGTSLLYSTYLGGSGDDFGSGVAVDASGLASITGGTSATADFPVTPDAIQPGFGGGPNDAFVATIDPSQSGPASLVYSSYLGGSGDEDIPSIGAAGNPAGGIAVDSAGNIYVTGNTSSADLPRANPYQTNYRGGPSDAFVTKVGPSGSGPDFIETATPSSRTVSPGNSTTYGIALRPAAGFLGDVVLGVSGLPAGANATFDPAVITIADANAQSSTLTLVTDGSIAIDTYGLSVTASNASVQHAVAVALVVVSASNLADLSVTETGSPNPVEANTNLTYNVAVLNAGPATATGVTVSDTLPSGVVFVSVTPADHCVGTTTITCTIAALGVGGSVGIAIVVRPQLPGTVGNTVAVSGDRADPDTSNNSVRATITVESTTGSPTMLDPNLSVRTVVSGLIEPTGIAFLGPDDFLVLEKSTGQVKRVVNGVVQTVVLDLPVNSASERGLLGIALHPDFANNGFVYLYWTCRAPSFDVDCDFTSVDDTTDLGQVPLLGNRVDRFVWDGSVLAFDRNLIRLHAYQADADQTGVFNQPLRGNHNGGKLAFGPDGALYVLIGDNGRRGWLQNINAGVLPTGQDDQFGGPAPDNVHITGVILRLVDDGGAPLDNPFFDVGAQMGGEVGANIQKIFAYGVRNSFGMAFDPLTGKLWTEENGDDSFDEINLVGPGFNGGWVQIMGPSGRIADYKGIETSPAYFGLQQVRWPTTLIADTPEGALAALFALPGAQYTEALFSWKYAVAPSPIGFVSGAGLGPQYQGDLFVGAARTFLAGGYLFDFKLSADRSDLAFSDPRLLDRVADNTDKFDLTESESLLIGRDFGITTDIQTAPNGNLYVLSLSRGAVYEIFAPAMQGAHPALRTIPR